MSNIVTISVSIHLSFAASSRLNFPMINEKCEHFSYILREVTGVMTNSSNSLPRTFKQFLNHQFFEKKRLFLTTLFSLILLPLSSYKWFVS